MDSWHGAIKPTDAHLADADHRALRVSKDHGKTWTEYKTVGAWRKAEFGVSSDKRTCIACGETFDATAEFFNPLWGENSGYLSRRCKPCESKRLWQGDEWFWKQQRDRDLGYSHEMTPDEYHADDWGGYEIRRGNILDEWPEYGRDHSTDPYT